MSDDLLDDDLGPVDGTFPWRACIRSPDGKVVGAGILVDHWHVLTCAHVVSQAAGEDSAGGLPMGQLLVQFPFWSAVPASSGWQVPASVPSYGWAPADADGRGDLTLVLLSSPAPADLIPAQLDVVADVEQRPVRVFGHPPDLEDGVWADVRLSGITGPAGEWIQIDATSTVGRRVEQGFSGAGAIDQRTGRVLGVVVAEDPTEQNRVAWVIRTDVVVRYLPHLAPLLGHHPGAFAQSRPPARTGSVPQRRLSDAELSALFTRFWAVPAMPSRSARDFYLDALEKRLPGHLSINRQPDDMMDGWAMLFGLLDRPGSLRILAGLLSQMHAGHAAVIRFAEFVTLAFPDLLLEQSERVGLEGRLMGVSWTRIGAAHRFATGRFGIPSAIAPTAVSEVIRDLEARGRSRGDLPALLVMVDDLAHAIGGNLSLDLHRWSDQVADRLGVPRPERHRMCDEATRRYALPVSAYLVVMLDPDGVDPDRFLMSAVVMLGDEPERALFRDDLARTLTEIEEILDDEVLPLVPETVGGDAEALVVEFVLPDRLLTIPVERWMFDRRSFARPIGIRYPVVVRSRERILDSSTHDLWAARTGRMHGQGRQAGEQSVHFVRRDARTEQAPPEEAQTLWAGLVGAEEAVALGVPFPPGAQDRGRDGRGPDVFTAAFKAGLPALVWPAVPTDPAVFEDAVRAELLGEGPAELPRQVWRYRLRHRGAISPGSATDESRPPLALVFDDKTRIPGQLLRTYRFRSPGPSQGPGGNRR